MNIIESELKRMNLPVAEWSAMVWMFELPQNSNAEILKMMVSGGD